MLGVDRDDLGPRGPARARWTTGAPAMIDSLLARASRRPASRAARVTRQPGEADHPVDRHVGQRGDGGQPLGARHHLDPGGSQPRPAPGPGRGRRWPPPSGRSRRAWATSSSTERWAPRATTSKRSGHASMTSMAWVPMDPVDPTRLTVTGRPGRPASGPGPVEPVGSVPLLAGVIPLACPKFRQCSGRGPGSRWREHEQAGRRPGRGHPPWPGSRVPMSFSRRSRLSRDSHRSPMGATTATTTPSRAALEALHGWMLPDHHGRDQDRRRPPPRAVPPRSCWG